MRISGPYSVPSVLPWLISPQAGTDSMKPSRGIADSATATRTPVFRRISIRTRTANALRSPGVSRLPFPTADCRLRLPQLRRTVAAACRLDGNGHEAVRAIFVGGIGRRCGSLQGIDGLHHHKDAEREDREVDHGADKWAISD